MCSSLVCRPPGGGILKTQSCPSGPDDVPVRRRDVHDQFDVTLEDDDLLAEVELTTNLIIAASESDGPLTQEQIDAILGLAPPPPA